eukprot:gene23396-biopygen8953
MTCESRKMLLDPFESQCLWQPPLGSEGSSGSTALDGAAAVVRQITGGRVVDTVPIASTVADEATSCRFNGSNSSTLAFVVSYVITSVFAGVLGLMLDQCQECAVVGLLVVCNGGALYYIVSKAAVRGYGWQVSFLKISLFEWFSEVVLLRGVEIALFDYGLCWLVGDEVEAVVRRLEAVAAE